MFDAQLQARRRLLPLDVHHRRHVLPLRREEGELHTQAGRRCAITLTKQSYRPTGDTLLGLEAAAPYAVDRVEDDLLRLLANKEGRVEWEGCRQMKKRGESERALSGRCGVRCAVRAVRSASLTPCGFRVFGLNFL